MNQDIAKQKKLEALKREIDKGLACIDKGLVSEFNRDTIEEIKRKGRELLTGSDEKAHNNRKG